MSLLFKPDNIRFGKPKLRTWPKVVGGLAFLGLLHFGGKAYLKERTANEALKQRIATSYVQHNVPATPENLTLSMEYA